MKKTYISPEALTVSLTMCNIIAQSQGNFNFNDTGTTGSTNFIEEEPTGDVLTKGYKNVWDTEW